MWRNSGGREKSFSSSSSSLSSFSSSSSSSSSSQSGMGVGNQSGWRSRRCEMTQGAAGTFHHFLSVMYAWGRGRWQSLHTHTCTHTVTRVCGAARYPPSSRLFHLSPCYFAMNMWIELTELYDGNALMGTRTFARRRSPSCHSSRYNTNIVWICIIAFAGRHNRSLIYRSRRYSVTLFGKCNIFVRKVSVYCMFVCGYMSISFITFFLLKYISYFLFHSIVTFYISIFCVNTVF